MKTTLTIIAAIGLPSLATVAASSSGAMFFGLTTLTCIIGGWLVSLINTPSEDEIF
jgi:hypothetical protein